jgi:hypothetical protein
MKARQNLSGLLLYGQRSRILKNKLRQDVAAHNFIGILWAVSSISSKKWISARLERAFFLS